MWPPESRDRMRPEPDPQPSYKANHLLNPVIEWGQRKKKENPPSSHNHQVTKHRTQTRNVPGTWQADGWVCFAVQDSTPGRSFTLAGQDIELTHPFV